MRYALALLLMTVTLLSSACVAGAGGEAPTPAALAPSPAPASAVPSVLPGSSSKPDPQPAREAALDKAAEHLGVSRADLHIDQVDARQWPDSSLGCPQSGLMYSQIVTPGFVVVVSGAGKQLEYHTDASGRAVTLRRER